MNATTKENSEADSHVGGTKDSADWAEIQKDDQPASSPGWTT